MNKLLAGILIITLVSVSCASTKGVQINDRINLFEQRLEKERNKNSQLEAKLAELERLVQEQAIKEPLKKTSEACGKPKLPIPVAPVRPILRAYINYQIADGPTVIEIENCSDHIWMALEVNGVPVECIINGFPNIYATNLRPTPRTCIAPHDKAYIILPDIRGTTTITVNGFIGITPPLKYQGRKILPCKFYPSVPHHQVVRIDRFNFQ